MEFDRIYAEVDLGRIEENMKAMKEHLRPGTKMYGVVKTDGCIRTRGSPGGEDHRPFCLWVRGGNGG